MRENFVLWRSWEKTLNKLVITRWEGRTLTALLTDDELQELSLEDDASILGNIYIGKVKNVVKNLNSAFIDYSEEQTGYYSLTENPVSIHTTPSSGTLKAGDEIVVQVAKDAVKTKDPVLTSNLNFAGKYAVLTAGKSVIGFSAKITDREWKEAVRQELEALTDGKAGIIVRTNAYQADRQLLIAEIERLLSEYQKVLSDAPFRTCYSLLYQAQPGYFGMLNSCPEGTLDHIITDDETVFRFLSGYVNDDQIRFYQDPMLSLSRLYRLDTAMEQVCQKRVWLKSGGYLVIEQTEAMVVIDVNTGKYTGKKKQEDAIRKINLEAAEEIGRQLRLRNLSGIIMVDFIDMKAEEDKQLLLNTLKHVVSKDPVKTTVIDMTPLNLVEMTRKKGRKPLAEQIYAWKNPYRGVES